MPKRNKLFILIIGELLFFSSLLIILPSILIKKRDGISQTSYSDVLSLDVNHSFTQKFIADYDNLRSISVLLKNPGIINKSQIEIETQSQSKMVSIELQDKDKNTINSLETSGLSIGDPSWITYNFPYIDSKKGDIFYIKVSTNNELNDQFFIYGDNESKSINFRSNYTSKNFKESFQKNIAYQLDKFRQRKIVDNFIYFGLILFLDILIIL
ncbi:MAG: hypothetical protein PHE32_02555 [Candidatus Shapirobacteria bacterium]|nr:hypothetical protein [Candidatus Shapirobacteria bacterium]MDD4410553.1 hypothetical protein [Candidatus Shapirobacteria bacterium]